MLSLRSHQTGNLYMETEASDGKFAPLVLRALCGVFHLHPASVFGAEINRMH